MKKNKKTGCIIGVSVLFILIVGCIAVFVGLSVYYQVKFSASLPQNSREWIEYDTEIAVPQDSQMVFEYKGDHGFAPGRAIGYYVFKFESAPLDWLEENNFSEQADESFEDLWSDYIPEWVEPVSSEYIPDFEKPYYCLKAPDAYYFVYQPDKMMLMVFALPW